MAAFAPYISSAFVSPDTMPAGLQWVAENQPVTPIVNTLRDLTLGAHVGSEAFVALGWCVAGAIIGRVGAGLLFRRR